MLPNQNEVFRKKGKHIQTCNIILEKNESKTKAEKKPSLNKRKKKRFQGTQALMDSGTGNEKSSEKVGRCLTLTAPQNLQGKFD